MSDPNLQVQRHSGSQQYHSSVNGFGGIIAAGNQALRGIFNSDNQSRASGVYKTGNSGVQYSGRNAPGIGQYLDVYA